MKVKILSSIAILFMAAGCNVVRQANAPTPTPTPQQTTQPAAQSAPSQTYVNGTYNFQFNYSPSMVFVDPTYGTLPTQIVQLQLPKSAYPNTNFGDAGFTVSYDYKKSLADCLGAEPINGPGGGFSTKTTINGIIFYQGKSTGVGAGNIYDSHIYRTFAQSGNQKGACFDLTETVHTGNIANYPQGTVSQVDEQAIFQQLDKIADTFKFTK